MPAADLDSFEKKSYQDFSMIIYPNEDRRHRLLLEYVINHDRLFKCVYIEHDSDVWCEDDEEVIDGKYNVGDPKKLHTHLLVHCQRRWTPNAFLKFFDCWIDYVKPCYNMESAIAYFCHQTPHSFNKHQYDPSSLKGDRQLISKVFGQNPYFVQLGEFAEQCRQGANISDIIIDSISIDDNSKRNVAFETFNKYSHVICCMSNQEKNDIKERFRSSRDGSYIGNDFDTEIYPQMKVGDFIES